MLDLDHFERCAGSSRSHGLFIALPGINPYAKGFYRDNCESDEEVTFRLYEEEAVVETILDAEKVVRRDTIAKLISSEIGSPGGSSAITASLLRSSVRREFRSYKEVHAYGRPIQSFCS